MNKNGRRVRIDRRRWTPPAVFGWLDGLGNVGTDEMFRVFNMGIGMTLLVNPDVADSIQRQLSDHRISSCVIGDVVEGEPGVDYVD